MLEGNPPADPPALPTEADRGRSDDEDLLDIVTDFLLRREDGEDPTVEDYQARYPRYAEDLAYMLAEDSEPRSLLSKPRTREEEGESSPEASPSVGEFELLEKIAVGGGGTVYRGRHPQTGQLAAVKILDGFGLVNPVERERFLREIQILRRLNLVGVVPILGAGEDSGRLYMATRWIEGTTLSGIYESLRNSRETQAPHFLADYSRRARLIAQLARTFQGLHERGILHRDIKPSNILVDPVGEPLVIDFGIARMSDAADITITSDGPMGTPRYLAPELILGSNRDVSVRSDIYGLGLCLYELCTRERAFLQTQREELFRAISKQGPRRPRDVDKSIPFALEAIILRATEIVPARRYASMAEFAADLEAFAEGRPLAALTLKRAHPLRRVLHRHPKAVFASGLLFCILVVSTWLLARHLDNNARRTRAHEVLAPWMLVPRELIPGKFEEAQVAASELMELHDDDPLLALRAAWVPYLRGDYADARGLVGSPRDGESPAVSLLRAWLNFLMGRPLDAPDLIPGELDEERELALTDVRGTRRDWSAEAERRRLSLMPPPLPRFEVEFLGRLNQEPMDAAGYALKAFILSEVLPGDLNEEEAAPWVLRIRESTDAAIALDPTLLTPLWLRALSTVRYGNPVDAVADLEILKQKLPASPEVRVLYALALCDERVNRIPDALQLFEEAAALIPKGRKERSGISDATAFDDQAHRKLYMKWMAVATEHGDFEAVLRARDHWLEEFPDNGESTFWQDRFFRTMMDANVADARGSFEEALVLLEQAAEIHDGLALPLLEMAKIHSRMGETALAESALSRAKARRQARPDNLEEFLLSGFFGLRPFSATSRFHIPKGPGSPDR
jgi:serine/threonine-protein kinase